MASLIPHSADNALAYELIEAAVQETGRGRWFLAEYARRNRNADTLMLLDELKKVQTLLTQGTGQKPHSSEPIHEAILDIGRAIARTERDIRAIRLDNGEEAPFLSASDALDNVVETTQKATSRILSAAERVQEYAWTMREKNGADEGFDLLDSCASEIYVACGFQDLTAQRISKVVNTLRFVDERISNMLTHSGLSDKLTQELNSEAQIAPTPYHTNEGFRADDIWMSEAHQAEIDETFEFFTPAETRHEPTMVGAEDFDAPEANIITNQDAVLTESDKGQYEPHAASDTPTKPENGSDVDPHSEHGTEVNYEALLVRVEEMRSQIDQKNGQGAPSKEGTPPPVTKESQQAFDAYDGLSTEERLRSFR